jgi:hypothetical protein
MLQVFERLATGKAMNQAKRIPSEPQPRPNYHAYLLRLWREGEGAPWRASLQSADEAERIGFADLEQLVAYLLRLADGADLEAARSPPQTDATN